MATTGGGNSEKRSRSNVAAGSVWESRMRIDQVRGGVKVFSGGGVEKLDVDDMKSVDRDSEQTSRIGLAEKRRAAKSASRSIQSVGSRSSSSSCRLQRKKTCGSSLRNGERNCRSSAKKAASDNDDRMSEGLISRSDLKLSENREDSIGGSDDEIEKGSNSIQLETAKTRSDEEKGSGDDSVHGFADGEDEIEEMEERIDEKNISLDEEIVVQKNALACDYKQMNVIQISHSYSNLKQEHSSTPKVTVAKSSSRTAFSPVRKSLPKFTIATHPVESVPLRDSGSNQRVPQTHSKLQSLVDILMWKHVPRSSLVFGAGTFVIISSSYTRDLLDVSFVCVTSYLGLIYLAIIFLYESFRSRHIMEGSDMSYGHGMAVIGEEEAIWVLRLILPYLNEFLLKLKALFSGDPIVTMKLAAALYALARCGNSITIWKMLKLGFFAAFILPKFCSLYSAPITGYGKFWLLRFQDAWGSCSHKKVVGLAIFTVVWNLSSVVARIWAVFMLLVAVRHYQQSTIEAESLDEDGAGKERASNGNRGLQREQVMSKLRQGSHNTASMSATHVHVIGAKKCS